MYGKGTPQGDDDAFMYEDHYRRFHSTARLAQLLGDRGFRIAYMGESQGWAKRGDADPYVIRVWAVKEPV